MEGPSLAPTLPAVPTIPMEDYHWEEKVKLIINNNNNIMMKIFVSFPESKFMCTTGFTNTADH